MIRLEKINRVAVLTLTRPERRNALGSEAVAQLDRLFSELDADNEIGSIVLTGASPSFCAGSDLKELGKMDSSQMAHHEAATAAVARRIPLLDTPIIAAVEGHAFGGGFILACSCDLIVTSSEARWNLAEVPNGWLPPWGLQALTARVGSVTAKRLTFGHEILSGSEVYRLGLADYLVDEGQALEQAKSVAERLADMPAPAVASTKQFYASMIAAPAEVLDSAANRIFIENCKHDKARETLAKFGRKL